MFGKYHFKMNRFECSETSNNSEVNFRVHFKGNLFLKPEDETKVLERISQEPVKEVFNKITGQFALVIHDKSNGCVYLLRDHIGVIPFYYLLTSEYLLFSTTIHEMLAHYDVDTQPNASIFHEYFAFGYIAGENTFFDGIMEVLPGYVIAVNQNGTLTTERFYHFRQKPKDLSICTKPTDSFEAVFRHSFERQTWDKDTKRIGVLSSGGIDSSILVSFSRNQLGIGFPSYYIGNEGYKHNRIEEVEYLSSIFESSHTNEIISNATFADNLVRTITINEEPLNHPSSVLRHYLIQTIGDHVDVLLSGEGADSLYCGYYILDLVQYAYAKNLLWPITSVIFKKLFRPEIIKKIPTRVNKVLQAFVLSPDEYFFHFNDFSNDKKMTLDEILTDPLPTEFLLNYKEILGVYDRRTVFDVILRIYQSIFLTEALNTIFKIGEAGGIEHRHPFIDVELVDLFNSFPHHEKIRFFQRKHQVVALGKKHLPKRFFKMPKEGFGVPLSEWFYDSEGMGRFIDILSDNKTRNRGVINVGYMDKLLKNYVRKELPPEFFETILWPIINLEIWFRIFLDDDMNGYA